MPVNSPCRQSVPPARLCGWATSKPMSDGEDEDEGEEDEEPGGEEGGRHWELWLGTADWELCEGIWAELELLLLCMLPIPFSVRNSSKSMYWSWKRPPSAGRVRSHRRGPKNWLKFPPPFPPQPLLLLLLPIPLPLLTGHTPKESSSRSNLSLSARQRRVESLLFQDEDNER